MHNWWSVLLGCVGRLPLVVVAAAAAAVALFSSFQRKSSQLVIFVVDVLPRSPKDVPQERQRSAREVPEFAAMLSHVEAQAICKWVRG